MGTRPERQLGFVVSSPPESPFPRAGRPATAPREGGCVRRPPTHPPRGHALVPVAGRRGRAPSRAGGATGGGSCCYQVRGPAGQGPKSARWWLNLSLYQIDSRSRTTFFPWSTVILSLFIFVDSREINRGCVLFAPAQGVIWRPVGTRRDPSRQQLVDS